MPSKFFLERPVFAWVVAIATMAVGLLSIHSLPISQYPPIAPPSIAVDSFYPGASAETVENTVTQDHRTEDDRSGQHDLHVRQQFVVGRLAHRADFRAGTDPDIAWSKVQNKLQLAMASLPDVVQQQGVKVSKSTRNYLMVVGLISEDGSMNGDDLRDYAQSSLEKILSRVPGVGEVEISGSQYAMRVWVDPDKLTKYALTVGDVITALKSYNVEASAGQLGGAPATPGQRLNAAIVVQHLLQTPEQFANIPLRQRRRLHRAHQGHRPYRTGTERYDIVATYNGKPSAALAIRQASGANGMETADNIKRKLVEMFVFPPGMRVIYPYDTTPFTKVAIDEVVKTFGRSGEVLQWKK